MWEATTAQPSSRPLTFKQQEPPAERATEGSDSGESFEWRRESGSLPQFSYAQTNEAFQNVQVPYPIHEFGPTSPGIVGEQKPT